MNPIFNKHWAMEEAALRALAQGERKPQPQAVARKASAHEKAYAVVNGVAILPLVGPLLKYGDIFMELLGGTSTVRVKELFASALDDESVTAILLYVDSPGGSVAGTADLAEVVADSDKPVWAYISDLGASAAYWVASQADKVFANRTASVGSIGVYTVLADTSKLYEDAGVRVKLVKAGELKGAGIDGVPITDEALADVQREIDEIYQVFVEKVADGRDLTNEKALSLATGQCWIASKAQEFGLIDGIASVEEVLTQMSKSETDNTVDGVNAGGAVAADAKIDVVTKVATEAAVIENAAGDIVERATDKREPAATVTVDRAKFEAAVAAAVDVEGNLKAAKIDAYNEGLTHERQRLEALMGVCAGKPSFVIEQFLKGNDKGKAAVEYAALLEKELGNSRASAGAEPIAVAVADHRGGSAASSREDFEREWEASAELQAQFPKKVTYAAYKVFEQKKQK